MRISTDQYQNMSMHKVSNYTAQQNAFMKNTSEGTVAENPLEPKDILELSTGTQETEEEVVQKENNWFRNAFQNTKEVMLRIWNGENKAVSDPAQDSMREALNQIPAEGNTGSPVLRLWNRFKLKVLDVTGHLAKRFGQLNDFHRKQDTSGKQYQQKKQDREMTKQKKTPEEINEHLMDSYDSKGNYRKLTILK